MDEGDLLLELVVVLPPDGIDQRADGGIGTVRLLALLRLAHFVVVAKLVEALDLVEPSQAGVEVVDAVAEQEVELAVAIGQADLVLGALCLHLYADRPLLTMLLLVDRAEMGELEELARIEVEGTAAGAGRALAEGDADLRPHLADDDHRHVGAFEAAHQSAEKLAQLLRLVGPEGA